MRRRGQFHDRAVVASLKHAARWRASEVRAKFHDRAVVASLKLNVESFAAVFSQKFHDRAVVASLKPCKGSQQKEVCPNSTTARSWPH